MEVTREDLRRILEDMRAENVAFYERLNFWAITTGASIVGALIAAIRILWSALKRSNAQIFEAHNATLQEARESAERRDDAFNKLQALLKENLEAGAKNRSALERLIAWCSAKERVPIDLVPPEERG